MVHFLEDGIAQSLFSKFTAYQSLESGPNWKETLLKEYDSVNQSVVMCAS